MYQHDLLHVDVPAESLYLENGNTVRTPMLVERQESSVVDTEQISKSRSHVGRCWFLSQERADNVRRERVMQESVRSFTTRLHQSEAARSVDGNMSSEVTVFSGSGWAGDKETRKSSSAGVALVGRHFF